MTRERHGKRRHASSLYSGICGCCAERWIIDFAFSKNNPNIFSNCERLNKFLNEFQNELFERCEDVKDK